MTKASQLKGLSWCWGKFIGGHTPPMHSSILTKYSCLLKVHDLPPPYSFAWQKTVMPFD